MTFQSKFVEECATTEAYENLFLQLHSRMNGCGPFQVTGYTGNYKEEGDYTAETEVTSRAVRAVNTCDMCDSPVVAVALNARGEVVDHMSLTPPA